MDITIVEYDGSLSDADITLKKPDGTAVDLFGTDGIKYFRTTGCITLKMVRPEMGTWRLEVNGQGQVVLYPIKYVDMHIAFEVITPGSEPDMANIGEEVLIVAQLQGKNGGAVDGVHYQDYEQASFDVTPRNGGTKKSYTMSYDPSRNAFVGKFTMELGVFDIQATVKTPAVEDSASFTVSSDNRPPVALGDLGSHKVAVRKNIEISNIFGIVNDPDGDTLTATITAYSPTNGNKFVDAVINGDKIEIKGKKWGDVVLTVTYTDIAGNTCTASAAVHVTDWLLVAILSAIPFLIAICVLIAMFFVYKNARKIRGSMTFRSVNYTQGDTVQSIGEAVEIDLVMACKGSRNDLASVASAYADAASHVGTISQDQKAFLRRCFGNIAKGDALTESLRNIHILGTPFGNNGIVLRVDDVKKTTIIGLQSKTKHRGEYGIKGNRDFSIRIQVDETQDLELRLRYSQSGGLSKKGGKKKGAVKKGTAKKKV